MGLHSSLFLIHSRGLLPRPASVHPFSAGSTRHYEPCASTAATTTSASSTHPHQTGTQTGTVNAPQPQY